MGVERDPAYTSLADADLIVAIESLDEAALSEVYQRHAGAVFALASRVLVERTHAEEIVQEVFLRLWEHPERFDGIRGSLRAFLLMETHARSVDRIRAEERRRVRETCAATRRNGQLQPRPRAPRPHRRRADPRGRLGAHRPGARGDRARVLRRQDLPPGRVAARTTRGNDQEPDPQRADAPAATAPRTGNRRVMDPELSAAEIEDLLAAYAIDAVDDDERVLVARYLETHPDAATEVQAFRHAAALLAYTGGPVPDGVWDVLAPCTRGATPAGRGRGRRRSDPVAAAAVRADAGFPRQAWHASGALARGCGRRGDPRGRRRGGSSSCPTPAAGRRRNRSSPTPCALGAERARRAADPVVVRRRVPGRDRGRAARR